MSWSGLAGMGRLERSSEVKPDHMYYFDDFMGKTLRDEWDASAGGGGTAPTVDATGEDNGTIKMLTGGATGGWSLLQFNRTHFRSDLKPWIDAYLKIDDVSECDFYIGFVKDADEYCYFHIDNLNIRAKSDDGGVDGPYTEDTFVDALDNTWIYLTAELLDTETGRFWINGQRRADPTVGAVTADLMDVYIYLINTSDNPVVATVEYIRLWQRRA